MICVLSGVTITLLKSWQIKMGKCHPRSSNGKSPTLSLRRHVLTGSLLSKDVWATKRELGRAWHRLSRDIVKEALEVVTEEVQDASIPSVRAALLQSICHESSYHSESVDFVGGGLVGVWNGWGYGIAFFGPWIFKFRSLKFGNFKDFLEISASLKIALHHGTLGKWPFHALSAGQSCHVIWIFSLDFLGPSVPFNGWQNDTRKIYRKFHNIIPV